MKRNRPQLPKKQTLRLAPNHTWKAPPGYKVLVVERGRVSFNIPEDWLLINLSPIELHNAQPPHDDARLMMTVFQFSLGIDWTGLPLLPLLEDALSQSKHDVIARIDPMLDPRTDIEFAWAEQRFIDPVETPREAFSRIGMARGSDVHILITFDFWVDQAEQFLPVWEEATRSLQLGRQIDDPTRGPTLH